MNEPSTPAPIGFIKKNNGILGPGFREWNEPVFEQTPAPMSAEQIVRKIRATDSNEYGIGYEFDEKEAVQLLRDWLVEQTEINSDCYTGARKEIAIPSSVGIPWSIRVPAPVFDYITALRTVIAKKDEALKFADSTNSNVEYYGHFPNRPVSGRDKTREALALTPATVADELAAKDKRIAELEKLLQK